MAGRPAKHSSNVEGHRTQAELDAKKDKEELAGAFPAVSLTAPDWLDGIAKQEYERVAKFLVELNVTELDQTSLVMYANSYSQYRLAAQDVKRFGIFAHSTNENGETVTDTTRKNPAVAVMGDMSREVRAYASSLGMTLDSRMKLVKPPEKPDENDQFANYGGDK